MIYIVLISYIAYWIIEAFHDDKLREINNIALSLDRAYNNLEESRQLKKLTSKWHSLDWVGHAILAVLTGYLASTNPWDIPIYAVMIGSLRVLILNLVGNVIADRSTFYVGNRGIEGKFKGKEILYYILWFALLSVSLLKLFIT